jgi:hypothetical protein
VTATAAGARRVAVVALVLALALAFAASACTGDGNDRLRSSRTALENTTAKDFFVSLPDGEASLSLNGKLPPDWPSDFPLPSDAKPEGSGSIGGSSSTTQVAVYSTTQPADDVFDFYKSNAQLDVSSPKSAGAGESFLGTLEFSGTFDGSLAVLAHDDKTFLVIVLHANSA